MNELVLRLAFRTGFILESACQEKPGAIQAFCAVRYFSALGMSAEGVDHLTGDLFPASLSEVCTEINNSLDYHGKVSLLLLVQDSLLTLHDTPAFAEHIHSLFNCLGIESSLIRSFRTFLEQDDLLTVNTSEYLLLSPQQALEADMLEGRWIEDNVPRDKPMPEAITLDQFNNHLLVMFVDQIKAYVVRCINKPGPGFDQDTAYQCRFRLLRPGQELTINGVTVISFSGLKSRFLQLHEKRELTLAIDRITYTNISGYREIQTFSAHEQTGQLIGIVGREGVGKSTLLKLLAGKFKPDSGSVYINGYDLWKNKYLLKGVIGFVPEEDLLFEDLSVADNLALTARLYYSSLSRKEIDAKVNNLLSQLDLLDLKYTVVKDAGSKHIQPGQRRLINIALELLREPQILLVDNALSGLGMADAARVIRVLHNYSFSGNLVITSISQADNETFMLFDKIWILDEAGSAVFNGTIKAATDYLHRNLKLTYRETETIDPGQLLDLVGYRLPDRQNHVWKRVLEPGDWHNHYLREQALAENSLVSRSILPARILKIPNLEIQLFIFAIRNFKCKFSRINEIIKALVIGPVIALLIAVLFRFSEQEDYSLLTNPNLPMYQFISVIVAVFLGLIASVDEILRERNILEKEEYLEFSRFSYLNSKIMYLFPVIAIQVFLYVLTGNLIMELKELFWVYWIVLFSSACFGVLLGLVFSASIYNRSFIHKGVLPFVIALQVLLGGGMISFNQLNFRNNKYTPVLGDLMVTRWGFEALAVEQYKNNGFEKLFYPIDKKIDQADFYAYHMVPCLVESLAVCLNSSNKDSVKQGISLLQHELTKVAGIPGVFVFEYLSKLPEIRENEDIAEQTGGYLSTYLITHFTEQRQLLLQQKDSLMNRFSDSLGVGKMAVNREKYHNLALEELVTNNSSEKEYTVSGQEIVRTKGMIYQDPPSNAGRAGFFSPVKRFNGQQTETLWFNISMIWLLTSLCYVWVLFDFTGLIRNVLRLSKTE